MVNNKNMRKQRSLTVTLVILILLFLFVTPVLAEGSRNLYPVGSPGDASRANLEWTTNTYGPGGLLGRRTILQVFMNTNEVLFLGSSAVGVDQANILVYPPGQITGPIGGETIGVSSYDCQAQRVAAGLPNTLGQITTRAMELAGPDTIPAGGNPGGYNPCTFVAPATGIYGVIFYGPDGVAAPDAGGPTGEYNLGGGNNFNANQNATVAAWDATVRNALNSATDINGRVFSYYLSLLTGGNGRRVYSTFFPVTTDGYIYETTTRGFDPNGYLVYGNQAGFLDSDGATPLYHDVLSTGGFALPSLEGGAGMQRPQYPIFFSMPDPVVLTQLGIPLNPIAPIVSNVVFNGSITGNTSLISTGGNFSFDANVASVFELVISRDGVDFDPTTLANRVLRGNNIAGTNTVNWNGLDNIGNPFPVGTYSVRVGIRSGEYHFPLIDAENSINGGPSYFLRNPPGGVCPPLVGGCNSGFYDDRGYTLLNGTTVGTVNVALCGNLPPVLPSSDLINGFNTLTNQRAFGDVTGGNINAPCIGAFGDVKGLDLWTYYPSSAAIAPLVIVDTIPPTPPVPPAPPVASSIGGPRITKTVNPPFAQPGDTVTWTIVIDNPSNATISNLVMTDTMPSELAVVSAVPSMGSASINGQQIQFTIPSLNVGQAATLTVTSRVRDNASVPFVLQNLACLTSSANSTPLCASATVISVGQLPATGQSPYGDGQQLVLLMVGVMVVLGARQIRRRRVA